MVRPERLFGLRPHPFGVALRAINLAEDGQVVELGLSMSGVRTRTPNGRNRLVILNSQNYGAPGEIRTPDLLVRSQALYPTELRARKGREYYHINPRVPLRCDFEAASARNGGEGGIARDYAARPALRCGPLQPRCNVQNRLRRFC